MSKLVDENTLQATVGSIREAVDNRINTSRKDLAKLDKDTEKVLADMLPKPVVKFSGIYELSMLTLQAASATGDVSVIYYPGGKTFVALKDGKYYNNWGGRSDYTPSAGGEPYADRLYLNDEDDELYAFIDSALRPVTVFKELAKIDSGSKIVRNDHLAGAVSLFRGFFEYEENEDGDMVLPEPAVVAAKASGDFEIWYHQGKNTFLAKQGEQWHSSFDGMKDYVVSAGGEPRRGVVFLINRYEGVHCADLSAYSYDAGYNNPNYGRLRRVLDLTQYIEYLRYLQREIGYPEFMTVEEAQEIVAAAFENG